MWRITTRTTCNTIKRLYFRQKHTNVKSIINGDAKKNDVVVINGWVRSTRAQKRVTFVNVCDGTSADPLQVVSGCDETRDMMASLTTGTSVEFKGVISEKPNRGNIPTQYELHANSCEILGSCDAETYPFQKKFHSLDFLRENLHLRPRTKLIGAVTRLRSEVSFALQKSLRDEGFLQVHTPILTSNDCEGAGELFNVRSSDGKDFFGTDVDAYLTVSGQLHAEMFACSLGRAYTFGPTFRAEDSQTSRHLAEFWMLEPEMAFARLEDLLDTSEKMLRDTVRHILACCEDDLHFFETRSKEGEEEMEERPDLRSQLYSIEQDTSFVRMTYTEAVQALESQSSVTFDYPVKWGAALQTEHERWLCETYCNGRPVFVTNYPMSCKPFYMRSDDDDDDIVNERTTVGAFDLLLPGIGELIGGSEREERPELLKSRMKEMNLLPQLDWYLDLRKYGTVRHGGFGLGFERLLMYLSGVRNIRDVIAVPRYPGYIKY